MPFSNEFSKAKSKAEFAKSSRLLQRWYGTSGIVLAGTGVICLSLFNLLRVYKFPKEF